MKILVIGRGGREHAIVWKLAQSRHKPTIYAAPGNDGMIEATCINIDELDNEKLVSFAKKEKIDLTIVGPDAALMNGVVDAFLKENLKIFGPKLNAAILEGSKKFTKDLMKKYDIPSADYQVFSKYEDAVLYLDNIKYPIVIKYDGLAAGKGVVIACSRQEAICTLEDMLINKQFGYAEVVIEEYMEGPEFSLMAFVNKDKVYPMVIAQDHKRAYDGDNGPNTGGMGAYSPVPVISDEALKYSVDFILKKAAKAMVSEKRPFLGIMYAGLMLTSNGVRVIEFNARFGDPETEVVLPRLKNDLVEVILNVIDEKEVNLEWETEVTLGVVMASKGYPKKYEKGFLIENINGTIFHMGTKKEKDKYYTNGGRVLFVLGKGKTLKAAQCDVYNRVKEVKCDNLFFRTDIGHQIK